MVVPNGKHMAPAGAPGSVAHGGGTGTDRALNGANPLECRNVFHQRLLKMGGDNETQESRRWEWLRNRLSTPPSGKRTCSSAVTRYTARRSTVRTATRLARSTA